MAKVTKHKKSAKGKFDCVECRKPILKGEEYLMWSLKSGRGGVLRRQHASHGHPRRSLLTLSQMSGAYGAIESAELAVKQAESLEDITLALEECANDLESVRDDYQNSIDNMPEGFQQGDTGQDMQTKIEELDTAIEEINRVKDEVESEYSGDDEPNIDDAKNAAQEGINGVDLP